MRNPCLAAPTGWDDLYLFLADLPFPALDALADDCVSRCADADTPPDLLQFYEQLGVFVCAFREARRCHHPHFSLTGTLSAAHGTLVCACVDCGKVLATYAAYSAEGVQRMLEEVFTVVHDMTQKEEA